MCQQWRVWEPLPKFWLSDPNSSHCPVVRRQQKISQRDNVVFLVYSEIKRASSLCLQFSLVHQVAVLHPVRNLVIFFFLLEGLRSFSGQHLPSHQREMVISLCRGFLPLGTRQSHRDSHSARHITTS